MVKQSRIMSKVKAGIKIKLNPTSEEGVPSPGGGEGDDKSNPPPDAPPTEETPDLEGKNNVQCPYFFILKASLPSNEQFQRHKTNIIDDIKSFFQL